MKPNARADMGIRFTRSAAAGFSLIELLIGAVVFVIVLFAIYMILDTSQRDYASGVAKSDVQENVRVALESMARELRMAGYTPSNIANPDCASPPCGITALTSSSVTFQANVDLTQPTVIHKVIYAFVPPTDATKPCDPSDSTTVGKITRSVQAAVGGAWSPSTPTAYDVAQCVTDVTITYYDSSGNTPATPPNVRRINISIKGVENARGTSSRSYTVTTDVRLRNL